MSVQAHGAKKRCTTPVWLALVFPFLTSYTGNGGAKFSQKIGFLPEIRMNRWWSSNTCAFKSRALSPVSAVCKVKNANSLSGKIPDFSAGNPLGKPGFSMPAAPTCHAEASRVGGSPWLAGALSKSGLAQAGSMFPGERLCSGAAGRTDS
jgi:hypothetical protein